MVVVVRRSMLRRMGGRSTCNATVLFAQLRELRQDHQAVEFGSSL